MGVLSRQVKVKSK